MILASKWFGCPIDISKSLSLERFFDISCRQPSLCLRSPWHSAKRSAGITCSLQQRNLGVKKKRWDSGMLIKTLGDVPYVSIYVSIAVWHAWHTWHTLWEVNIAMENGPCTRYLPIEHADSGIISYFRLPEGLAMVLPYCDMLFGSPSLILHPGLTSWYTFHHGGCSPSGWCERLQQLDQRAEAGLPVKDCMRS